MQPLGGFLLVQKCYSAWVSKKRFVVGNWKLYIESPKDALAFAVSLRKAARGFAGVEAWLAPPFPFIADVAEALKGSAIKFGAQTLSPLDSAQDKQRTGEVPAQMLKDMGASFVLVGHSERRAQGETDEHIRMQLALAVSAGLTVILCVGETERVPDGTHFAAVANQLSRALHGAPALGSRLMVAYEPVWAIGKGAAEAMQVPDLEEMAIFIRKILSETLGREQALKVPILYGGSVEPQNAQALMQGGGVNGFLVGHASADIHSFKEILKACKK